jgi:hypothetical protein
MPSSHPANLYRPEDFRKRRFLSGKKMTNIRSKAAQGRTRTADLVTRY